MNYKDTIEYIDSFINFEKIPRYQYASSFRLERMIAFLDELGNPHKGLNVIHVAGSKGKGSTCAVAAYILKEAGYKVGLYTSPHLMDSRERIRILNNSIKTNGEECRIDDFEGMIREEEINKLIEEIKPIAEKFREHEEFGMVSFFEILTACAFLYFKQQQVDIAILETGMGGRLDATNVTVPLACGMTSISLEHTDKLGDTLTKIAYEKAEIVKDKGIIVSASQEKEAIEILRKTCREKNARLHEVGKDIKYSILRSGEFGQVFDLQTPRQSYKNLELNLIGVHQIENASISIGIIEAIKEKFDIKEDDMRDGLKKATWPGRLQIIRTNPNIILDGAQNLASMSALISSIKGAFKYKKLICVFGISSDKDIKGVSGILDAAGDIIILTEAKCNPRAEKVSKLKGYFQSSRPGIQEIKDADEALNKAIKIADKEDLILVTGSLFLVGDALNYFKNRHSN
ncbi:MAG: bifunctional folylpolyglutamate synthase/dihydrofolate synthase [Candidatus Omnitrophica bacterium CG_4_9_14_0_2_um_filter_42_8]|nr:MAG: bifunctional folylpolyglutamate synthase/dihydrofolate synthase [Candidatus Omnitrophica bacterium CG22_combo_CG10-13_8_21_14_all_43_16]PJC47257.1 MAG: bifunctional folylpolyglutamate synthase/dihydrofolate synthase [Candidatus Omnitrophica bacterium CG_4_9_14_0_2_um_filter_42_8]